MAIDASIIFEQKVREYKAESSSGRFKADFLRATNNALDKISIRTDLGSHPAHITRTDASISIDANRGYVLEAGIDYWLIKYGHRNGDLSLADALSLFNDAIRDAILDRDHDDMDAATDDEVIGNIPEDE